MKELYRPEKMHLDWHRRVVAVLRGHLGWESIDLLADLLAEPGPLSVGPDDGHNLTIRFEGRPDSLGHGWTIVGGCGYGSSVFATPTSLTIASCGGHWVAAHRVGGETRFLTDREPSLRSWGDGLCPECDGYGDDGSVEQRDCPGCGGSGRSNLTGRDLSNEREAALETAMAALEAEIDAADRRVFAAYMAANYAE